MRSDRLGGILVSVIGTCAEVGGFDPRPGKTKDIKKMVFGASLLNMQHLGVRVKHWSAQSQNNVSQ